MKEAKKNYAIDAFDEWEKVCDYESDENSVSLLDADGDVIAEFSYAKFMQDDFDFFKQQNEKK